MFSLTLYHPGTRSSSTGQQSSCTFSTIRMDKNVKKVQVGKDQEKAQSEKDSHSKNRGGKKNKLTIRYLYHENCTRY